MPIRTENYFLEAFLDGDAYSAIADKRRFTTIDNQLNRLAEIIGDGRIEGWVVSGTTFPNIQITLGNGIVDKFYVNTFNNQTFELSANGTFFLFIQRRIGVTGITGPRTDVKNVTYLDAGAPATPSDFVATVVDPFTITLEWTANTEIDLDHYEVERSDDGGTFTLISLIAESITFFEDTVEEDSTHDYRFYAVDESGFRSVAATASVVTVISTVPPPNPVAVSMPVSEAAINILWKRPLSIPFSKIEQWRLTYSELDTNNVPILGTTTSRIINKALFNDRIDDLKLGQRYQVILQTIDTKGRASTGVVKNVTPQPTPAPRDPQGIAFSMLAAESGVRVDLSWIDGDTPYDPAISFRYKIYVTVDGQQEAIGIDVPIGQTQDQITLFTFNLLEYFPIPENILVTFRITALDDRGFESFGNYARFITSVFSLPKRLTNLTTVFDVNEGIITVTWGLQPDTADVLIVVEDDDLSDAYTTSDVIVNQRLGLSNRFVFSADLNHKYTVSLTPFNDDEVAGPTSVSIEITLTPTGLALPEAPTSIESKSGDKQIQITWNESTDPFALQYRLYRRLGSINVNFSSWTLRDIIPNTILSFTDFGLTNDQVYSYYLTVVDIYGRESLHLPDGAINLNFIEETPKSQGNLTEPTNLQVSISGNSITLTWESLLEEFDGFTIYRSLDNLHSWTTLATVDSNTLAYVDTPIPLVNQTIFYYTVDKTVNDADIVVQTTNVSPENAIFLAKVVMGSSSLTSISVVDRRDIKDMLDPITEFTTALVLTHKHTGIGNDPTRIDLNPELRITDWTTVDGRIFTTLEEDISGSSFIVKVDGKFPSVFFEVNILLRQLIFSEPIVAFDPATGVVIGEIPEIEVRVLGVEEVKGVLEAFRFDKLHARQVQFGALAKEQIPSINHEGRIREELLPDSFLLARFSNHTFTISEDLTPDDTKNFGDGTTFYDVIESDGKIEEVIDFDLFNDETQVGFREPSFSSTTVDNILSGSLSEVNSDPGGFQSTKSYNFQFEFVDNAPTRWVRVVTTDTESKPNPVIDLTKRLRFRMLLQTGSIYLTLGIREIDFSSTVGNDGGTVGPIEWVGASTSVGENIAPIGILINASDDWQEIDIDLQKSSVLSFEDGNNSLTKGFGVIEHFAFTINPDSTTPSGPFSIFIDKLEQVSDVLVAGTSQGILLSEDFGTTWDLARLTDTPVHKFFKSAVNGFLWAISASEVLLAVDPAFWFAASGTVGIQYIRDIVDDDTGNMFISTDKGVYWLEISLIQRLASFKQTQPINAFSTDTYALYHNPISSGSDEIWVSTEIGIFKTIDQGATWEDTDMDTSGLVAFRIQNISTDPQNPNLIAITRKHVLRKLGNESGFSEIANLEEQFNITDIWVVAHFSGRLYISTGQGVFSNTIDNLFTSGSIVTLFDKVFDALDQNGLPGIVFGLSIVSVGTLGTRLFVGQENRLASVNESNVVRIRKEFRNKELPSFFIDDVEVIIGFIYNAFNNVLVFREPQPINSLYSSANLPRRVYVARQKGWAQTNPNAEVFIFKNGVPKWLDFVFDVPEIISEVQIIEGELEGLPTLTSFNSLTPLSQTFLDSTLTNITTIKEGNQTEGQEGSPLVNNTTIIQLLDDYTRFISLITESLASSNSLALPRIIRAGIARSTRGTGTKAEILEQKEGFEANNSTSITIDTVTGTVDFRTALAQAADLATRDSFTFRKFDRLHITIFNSNISGTGEFTHRELEDLMEMTNTGLTSNLTASAHSNLIKAGIFIEGENPFMFDKHPASNIQSRFYAAHTNDWYDVLDSTLDWNSIVKINNTPESRFANVAALFTEDPYFSNKLWAGTDNDIIQYNIELNGDLTIEDTLRPGNGSDPCFINDIFIFQGDQVYVIATDQGGIGHVFLTTSFGVTWEDLDTINLPNQIFRFRILTGNRIVTTSEGPFFSDNNFGTWFPCSVVASDVLGDDSPSLTAFRMSSFNINLSTFIVYESDRWFFTSGTGFEFLSVGRLINNNATVVNKILRFKNLTWVATDRGFYHDGNSILSDAVSFGLQDLESSITASAAIEVNDIVNGVDALYCGASNSKIYRFFDAGSGNEWKSFTILDFGSIQKMILFETSSADYLFVMSHNKIRTIDVTSGTGVFG